MTPERIQELREAWSGHTVAGQHINECLDEIERLYVLLMLTRLTAKEVVRTETERRLNGSLGNIEAAWRAIDVLSATLSAATPAQGEKV